jgi:hypothetical protein
VRGQRPESLDIDQHRQATSGLSSDHTMEAVMTRSLLATIALGMALLAGPCELRAADAVPKFDIARGCKAEVISGVSDSGGNHGLLHEG